MRLLHNIGAFLKFYTTSESIKAAFKSVPEANTSVHEAIANAQQYRPNLLILEANRIWLHSNKSSITVLGLGSIKFERKIKVSDFVKRTALPPKYCELLFALARTYKPEICIDLGTAAGFSAAAMALAVPHNNVYTIEGSPDVAHLAHRCFSDIQITNIQQLTGNIDTLLPQLVHLVRTPFMAFVDGNHLYAPTIRYFNLLAEKANENSLIVLDDIYWSPEMEKAWNDICLHPRSTLCINLYRMGIVLFDPRMPKRTMAARY